MEQLGTPEPYELLGHSHDSTREVRQDDCCGQTPAGRCPRRWHRHVIREANGQANSSSSSEICSRRRRWDRKASRQNTVSEHATSVASTPQTNECATVEDLLDSNKQQQMGKSSNGVAASMASFAIVAPTGVCADCPPKEKCGHQVGIVVEEKKQAEQAKIEGQRGTCHPPRLSLPPLPEDGVATQDPLDSMSVARFSPQHSEHHSQPLKSCEVAKSILAILFTLAAWGALFAGLAVGNRDFVEPNCDSLSAVERNKRESCDACGDGTLIFPLFGEYENSWAKGPRVPLYFVGILCMFMGMGIVCDMFMDAIEEITSAERVVWRNVHQGQKQKFRVKYWNATMANLTLMALGSSAPEILLSATELVGNKYFAGKLGPSTIVGSAAFNLFVISAVCVAAIPEPETRMIEGTGVFLVTSITSLFAYIWLLVMLLGISPNKVDPWEGIVTLAFFPAFLILAFLADKKVGPFKFGHDSAKRDNEKRKKARISAQYGNSDLSAATIQVFMQQPVAKQVQLSRAQLRRLFTGLVTGGKARLSILETLSDRAMRSRGNTSEIVFGFEKETYTVLEDAGTLTVWVAASRPPEHIVQLRYYTQEGTAKEGLRYKRVEGFVSFTPGVIRKAIVIPILDNDHWEPDEEFFVFLSDTSIFQHEFSFSLSSGLGSPSRKRALSNDSMGRTPSERSYVLGHVCTTVTILNDDEPGTLDFDASEVFTTEGETVSLGIRRTAGSVGKISCHVATVDDSAIGGKDYEKLNRVIEFGEGETHKTVSVKILRSPDHRFESDEVFKVRLFDPSPGVLFDKNTDGGEECAICDVVIGGAGATGPKDYLLQWLNRDQWRRGLEEWYDQVAESFYVGGHPEDQAEAGVADWICHIMSLVFKITFVVVPPSCLGGGWFRFIVSLVLIGCVTALAGDISSLLGCCLGIPDDITAITLVALGTSLPDTLASKAAAQQDDTADNAIGNITGSNSVNVFLGIGISWTIGAMYWERSGTPSKEWKEHRYGDNTLAELYLDEHPRGGFFVPTDTLAFSVGVYLAFALLCLGYLYFRRRRYGGELGGDSCSQRAGFMFLFFLWVLYIISVSVYALIQ